MILAAKLASWRGQPANQLVATDDVIWIYECSHWHSRNSKKGNGYFFELIGIRDLSGTASTAMLDTWIFIHCHCGISLLLYRNSKENCLIAKQISDSLLERLTIFLKLHPFSKAINPNSIRPRHWWLTSTKKSANSSVHHHHPSHFSFKQNQWPGDVRGSDACIPWTFKRFRATKDKIFIVERYVRMSGSKNHLPHRCIFERFSFRDKRFRFFICGD